MTRARMTSTLPRKRSTLRYLECVEEPHVHRYFGIDNTPVTVQYIPCSPNLSHTWCFGTNVDPKIYPDTSHHKTDGLLTPFCLDNDSCDYNIGEKVQVSDNNPRDAKHFTDALPPLLACLVWSWGRSLRWSIICFSSLIAFFNIHPIQPPPQSGDALGPALAQPTRLRIIRTSSDQFVVIVIGREGIAVLVFLGELDPQTGVVACVLRPA